MMNESLRYDIITVFMKAALIQDLIDEVENAPSDEELRKMFPRTKKDGKLLKKYVRLEKKQEARRTEQPAVLTVLKRVAVIVMAVVSLSTAVMLTDTDIRAAVEHAVVEFFDKYAKVNLAYSDDAGDEVTDIYDLTVGYIPVGYELIEANEDSAKRWFTYYDAVNDKILDIDINYSNNSESDIDIENLEMTEITVNGYSGYMFYNEEMQAGSLVFGNQVLKIDVDGELSKDELIKIAENIK